MASMLLNRNLIADFWFPIGEKLGESTKRYCCALLTGLLVTASLFFQLQIFDLRLRHRGRGSYSRCEFDHCAFGRGSRCHC